MAGQPAPYTFDRVVRMVLSAAVLIGVFLLLRYLSDVLIPFAIAVVLAYLINPVVNLFQRLTKRRGLAVLLTLFGLVVALLLILTVAIPLLINQADRFRASMEKLFEDVDHPAPAPVEAVPVDVATSESETQPRSTIGWKELMEGWGEYRRESGLETTRERFRKLRARIAGTYIGSAIEETVRWIRSGEAREMAFSIVQKLAAGGWTVVVFALNLVLAITGGVLVLVYLVFLLVDYPEFAAAWPGFLPPQYRAQTVDFFVQFDAAMRQYFRGQSLVALFTGTLYAIGFTIIGLPMGLLFGLFIGLLNLVPYMAVLAIVPAMLLAVLRAIEGDTGIGASLGLIALIFAIVQVLQDTVITPKVMGNATGLRPIAILLGVFIWGKLLGFLGLILAIPLTCLGIAYYRRYILHREVSRIAV